MASAAEQVNSNSPINQESRSDIGLSNPDRIYLVTDLLHSPYTKRAYRLAFEQFQRDGARTKDLQVLLDHKPKVLEQMIVGYVEGLTEKGRARQTIALHVAAILHFFEINDVTLNKRKITRAIPRDESYQRDRPYTLDEITKIYNAAPDLRTKVMVSIMASTGCRVGALPMMKVGHLDTPQGQPSLYKIQIYANSRKDNYTTFCDPTCKAVIDAYLNYRRRLSETITTESPLIRDMFSKDNPFTTRRPRRCTDRMVFLALEKALHKAGVNQRPSGLTRSHRRATALSHGFRKHVITTMDRAGVKDTARRYLTGHAQVGQDRSYVLLNDDDLLQEYVKALPWLMIDPSQRLEHENQELREERSQEMIELRALKKEMDGIKMLLDMTKNKEKLLDHLEQEAGIRVQMEGDDPDEYRRTQHKRLTELLLLSAVAVIRMPSVTTTTDNHDMHFGWQTQSIIYMVKLFVFYFQVPFCLSNKRPCPY